MMRKIGHEISEVVDLPLVIETELDEIIRRRKEVDLEYDAEQDSVGDSDPAAAADSENVDETAPAEEDQAERDRVKNDLVGLAFSGGGIRSASFNLGMFQALHRAGFIRHTDYLSTVSGGGYIGAHVASLVLGNDVKMDRSHFPLAPRERGEQPERVIDFIRGGKYLVRQPLKFARWYFTGVVLNNLVLLSGLIAVATLIAMIWRSLDTWPLHGMLRTMTSDWSADWNRPFFVSGFALIVWMSVKAYQNWRSLGRRDGGLATTCLLIFYACIAIALGVLLGNGDIGGLNWTGSQSRNVWVPLMSILGVMLLPLIRPWRLLHSGTKPTSKAESAIFKLTSYALLAGVPLALIAYLAHENVSGHTTTRTDLKAGDIQDWRLLTLIEVPDDNPTDGSEATPAAHITLLESFGKAPGAVEIPPALKAELEKKPRHGAIVTPVTAQSSPPVTAQTISKEFFFDDADASKKFFDGVVKHMNQKVVNSESFALAAAATINDDFWDALSKKELVWRGEVDGKTYRRDVPEDYADYQILPDKRKAKLADWARKSRASQKIDAAEVPLFNRLYLEAAHPEFTINRNRILRSVVAVPDQKWRLKLFCISLFVFVVGLVLVDPNVTSIHRYYSHQLSRAYIEPVDGMGRQIPMCRLDTVGKGAPYLLINATVNLYGRRKPDVEPRDIFVFSRKFCGSPSTRFCPSRQYLGGSFDLANAMAISGGAVTTSSVANPLVAVMMFVLNFRLGQWLPNPREQSAFRRPALWQVVVDLFRETRKHSFCFISDGGHYENLGATALLERKCKIIVISDAGQDENHVFADFVKLYRTLRTRRGIQFFDLKTGKSIGLDDLMLKDPAPGMFHRGQVTQEHFVTMGIRYEDGTVGLLAYVKPSFTGDEEVDLESYRASNAEFPHQPTSDQVYDEIQFESYRQLGFHIGSALCGEREALWNANASERIEMLAHMLADMDFEQIERTSRLRGGVLDPADEMPADLPSGDVDSLLDQFRNGEPQVRILALKELVSLKEGAEVALPELIADLRNAVKSQTLPNAEDRAQLAWAIGTFGPKAQTAAKPLVTWLRDPSPEVRAASAEALGEIGVTTQVARKALEKAARDEVEPVRAAAEQTLEILGAKRASIE